MRAEDPVVGQNGLEYANFADLIAGKPLDCPRNDVIATLKDHPSVKGGVQEWVRAQYWYQNRNGEHYTDPKDPRITRPQGWDRHGSGA